MKRAIDPDRLAGASLATIGLCLAAFFGYHLYLSRQCHSRMQEVNAILEAKHGKNWRYDQNTAADIKAAFQKVP